MCFEFCSPSYLGTHTRKQRRDYTKQIFDFYDDNFPGISIYQDKNFQNPMVQDLFVAPTSSYILKVKPKVDSPND